MQHIRFFYCQILTLILYISILGFFWINPVYAVEVKPINISLEEQVLQIILDHPDMILESVNTYHNKQLEQQKKQQEIVLGEIKSNPEGVIGKSPKIGSDTQEIVLLEFADFQCPYCADVHHHLRSFIKKHQYEITFVYKHFPLDVIHSEAMPAARASWAAQQQGKFWEFHNALFDQQDQLGESLYNSIAKSLNLDIVKFNRDRKSNAANIAIQKDIRIAERLGIQGTPFLIMNGKAISGVVSAPEMENLLTQVQTHLDK